jgi:hypothetical protein
MHTDHATDATPIDKPLPAEFPLGIGAACLAMGLIFAIAPVRDGLYAAAALLAAAVIAAGVAVVVARSNRATHG